MKGKSYSEIMRFLEKYADTKAQRIYLWEGDQRKWYDYFEVSRYLFLSLPDSCVTSSLCTDIENLEIRKHVAIAKHCFKTARKFAGRRNVNQYLQRVEEHLIKAKKLLEQVGISQAEFDRLWRR
ncbi:MAG: hypothetical protein WC663_04095 [Patescibacteria group bacterium]|jgi:hypothetical protein